METKLTEDNLTDLLAQYLKGASFFGDDEASRAAKLLEIEQKLEEGICSMKEGGARPAEEMFEELRKEHGFPSREKDRRQDELRSKVRKAAYAFEQYNRTRERKRIAGSDEDENISGDSADKKRTTDAEWYCRRDPEEERFFEIFFALCRKYNIRWSSASKKEKAFLEEVTRVTFEWDRATRRGLPLADVRPSFE